MGSSDTRGDGASRPPREPFDIRELQSKIDAALEREHAVWGVLVHSTGLGRDVASRHPDTALVPASNVKMFTAMAALTVWTVGPHRTFDTRAHVVRDDSKGAVLCVHPSGDPTLRPADVDDLARASLASSDVPASEVRRVRLGGKEWQDEGAHPTWEVGDARRAWAAPPSRATMTSDEADGPRPPRDAAAPPDSPRRRLLHRLEATLELTPADPDLPRDIVPSCESCEMGDFSRIASRSSPPVSALVRAALEDSDNLVAEQLLRAASGGKDSGRFLTSWSAVQAHKRCPRTSTTADGASPTPRRIRFVDGSGLSRHNLAPPRAFVALVVDALRGRDVEREEIELMRQEKMYGPTVLGTGRAPCGVFLDALAVGGRTGTLRGRLRDVEGEIRAKTGSMTGTCAMSGYFEKHPDPALGEVIFSVIANNHVGNVPDAAHRLRDVVDEVVALISLARASGESSVDGPD